MLAFPFAFGYYLWFLSMYYILCFLLGSSVGFQVQARMPKDPPRESSILGSRGRSFEDIVALTRPPMSPDTARDKGRIKEEVMEENSGLTWVPMSADTTRVSKSGMGVLETRSSKPTRRAVLPDTSNVGLDPSSSNFIGFLELLTPKGILGICYID